MNHNTMETLLIILISNILLNSVEGIKDNRFVNEEKNDAPHFRIFQGHNATTGQFPYQVAVRVELQQGNGIQYSTICGGSILSKKKVLSAAHCFTTDKSIWEVIFKVPSWRKLSPLKSLYIVAGSLQNSEIIGPSTPFDDIHDVYTEQWRRVNKVVLPDKQYYVKLDVAVVFLQRAYTFNENVGSIPLATQRKEYNGLKCLASGFGLVSKEYSGHSVKQALTLQWAELSVVPTDDCNDEMGANMKKFVCTSIKKSDVRPGDSGGPLVCYGTGEKEEGDKGILVGIACAITDHKPSMFTRVTDYLDFINKAKDKP